MSKLFNKQKTLMTEGQECRLYFLDNMLTALAQSAVVKQNNNIKNKTEIRSL